jgi:hypothetical protein
MNQLFFGAVFSFALVFLVVAIVDLAEAASKDSADYRRGNIAPRLMRRFVNSLPTCTFV